jgi:hypothetical protein
MIFPFAKRVSLRFAGAVPIGHHIYNELKQKKNQNLRWLSGPVWIGGGVKLCTYDVHLVYDTFRILRNMRPESRNAPIFDVSKEV